MSELYDNYIDEQELLKFERKFFNEQTTGVIDTQTQFQYGWCLIQTKYKQDIKKGISLLDGLCTSESDERDYLFFIAIGYYKLGEYDKALRYTRRVLSIEPNNYQAHNLEKTIESKMKRDAISGVALVGGAAVVAVGAVIGAIFFGKK